MDEKEAAAVTTEKSVLLLRAHETIAHSRFTLFCKQHKLFCGIMITAILLLPLLGLLALIPGHARGDYTSPVIYPSRECAKVDSGETAYQ